MISIRVKNNPNCFDKIYKLPKIPFAHMQETLHGESASAMEEYRDSDP